MNPFLQIQNIFKNKQDFESHYRKCSYIALNNIEKTNDSCQKPLHNIITSYFFQYYFIKTHIRKASDYIDEVLFNTLENKKVICLKKHIDIIDSTMGYIQKFEKIYPQLSPEKSSILTKFINNNIIPIIPQNINSPSAKEQSQAINELSKKFKKINLNETPIVSLTLEDTLVFTLGMSYFALYEMKQGFCERYEKLNTDNPVKKFDSYFIDPRVAEKLIPYIKDNYTNAKPQNVAFLIFALKDLNLIKPLTNIKQTELHQSLENILGYIGVRETLSINITNLSCANNYQEMQISSCKEKIISFLKLK